MMYTVYLSGEIHSSWRQEIIDATQDLNIRFTAPVTDHPASDAAGDFLGPVEPGFWRDQQSSGVNAIRTRHDIDRADLVVVRFGDKYKQWNAAFDAGYCAAKGIPYITLHDDDIVHPLKEVDQAAYAWCKTTEQVVQLLRYVLTQS
ncbi:MAG: YtoQ family protein [Litorivicinaceae bacterium]